jgi:hypothetical protein
MVRLTIGGCFAFLVGVFGLPGCGPTRAVPQRTTTEERLYQIGTAYVQACYRLGRPPKDVEEIKPNLPGEFSDDLLRSSNDGEPLVIIWGTDPNAETSVMGDPYTVCAYEKRGVNGQRYVLRFPLEVVLLNEEAFRKSVFPRGHKPPL